MQSVTSPRRLSLLCIFVLESFFWSLKCGISCSGILFDIGKVLFELWMHISLMCCCLLCSAVKICRSPISQPLWLITPPFYIVTVICSFSSPKAAPSSFLLLNTVMYQAVAEHSNVPGSCDVLCVVLFIGWCQQYNVFCGAGHLLQSRPSVTTVAQGRDNSGQRMRYLAVTATE